MGGGRRAKEFFWSVKKLFCTYLGSLHVFYRDHVLLHCGPTRILMVDCALHGLKRVRLPGLGGETPPKEGKGGALDKF